MKRFIKRGIKQRYISKKPKSQQLYFIYKLMMNRKKFEYKPSERVYYWVSKLLCCFRKRFMERGRCSKQFKLADKKKRLLESGKNLLADDLDILKLIRR